jgi:hypothetical protein
MAQATSTPITATTRRKALAAIATGVTGAALVTPAIAGAGPTLTEPDPVFAAIEIRKQTYARYSEAHTRWCDNGEEPGALEEQIDEACYADNEALPHDAIDPAHDDRRHARPPPIRSCLRC